MFRVARSSPSVTIDTIYGFANDIDKIDLTAFGPLTLSSIATQSGFDVLLVLPTGKRVLIKNFLLASLDATDFVSGNVSWSRGETPRRPGSVAGSEIVVGAINLRRAGLDRLLGEGVASETR